MFHHDPDQTDAALDVKLDIARAKLLELGSKTQVIAPTAGESFNL